MILGTEAALRVQTLDPLTDARWQRFVEDSANGSIFHHAEWLRLLNDQYGYPMHAHCVTSADGEILAGLPFARIKSRLTGTRLVAVPFSDMCAPVKRDLEDSATVDRLLEMVRAEHERNGIEIEIRTELDGVGHAGHGFYQHELTLEADLAAVKGRFTKMASRGISRSARDGVEVVRGTGPEMLNNFYRLHLHTRRRQGVPTQPKRFIDRYARLFDQGLGFILEARSESQPIAAAVFLRFNGVLTYKYGASDTEHLKKRPNNALFMEAIRWGCEQGLHTFDLGRTDLDNEGLCAFKRGWGARERELTYTHLSSSSERSADSGVPKVLTTIIQRTPPITGRLVGAALYRHFG
jgi:CelD/BcsL family acetyltransferase involved in cellulose biosynthesis